MNLLVDQEINEAFQKINDLIMKTEEIYGTIFLKLPQIEEELELNLQEMDILLNYFIYRDVNSEVTDDHSEATQLAELLRNMKSEFTDAVINMFDEEIIRKTLDRFIANVNSRDEPGIDDLMTIIQKIKRHIQDIEVVSINAMIHSSRQGDDGKAFGVISRNIKEFSNDMKEQYNDIFAYAESLEKWNNEFTVEINKILQFSEELRINRLEEFHSLFETVFESLKTISILLKEANHNLHASMSPLHELMALIQKQDIIKQSLENVMKCLDGLREGVAENKDEDEQIEKLNAIVFESQVIDMSIALVENISEQLEESLSEIKETVIRIHNSLSETYEESSEVTEFLSGDYGIERNTVEEIFYNVKSFIHQFKEELENVAVEVESFSDSSLNFYEQMDGIENQIMTIKQRVDFLRNLNILSRIELSRLSSDIAAFGEEIEQISRRVIDEVNLNETFIVSLKETLHSDLERFFEMLELNKEMIHRMIATSEESLSNLEMIEELVIKAIQPTNSTSERLIEEVASVMHIVTSSEALTELMNEVQIILEKAREKIEQNKEKIFQEANVTHWENSNATLQQLFDKLTTYYERVVFNNHAGDEFDVGSEAGELVLF